MAVEEEDDRYVGDLPFGGGVTQGAGDGHAAHAADLHVDEDDVRLFGGDRFDRSAGIFAGRNPDVGFGDGGEDVVADPGRVGDEEERGHRRGL